MKSPSAWTVLFLALALPFVVVLAVFAQPPIPHPVQVGGVSYEDCVACHRTGENNATIMPDDHARRKNFNCRGCHDEMQAPNVQHPTAGWENCLGCHEKWQGSGIEIPNLIDAEHDHGAYGVDDCSSCHLVSAPQQVDERSSITCSVCHPQSTAARTVHNGLEHWVDCVECHPGATDYLHDPERIQSRDIDCLSCHQEYPVHERSAIPDQHYDLLDHIAVGAPHVDVDCSACHLKVAAVERDSQGRVGVVLPGTGDGSPPDDPELGVIGQSVDCLRCHMPDNRAAAPAIVLPPRSILCMGCHDALPVVQDALSGIGIGVFSLGMIMVASIYVQGSVGGRQGGAFPARLGHILLALFDLAIRRFGVFVRAFVLDGLLHRQLFAVSKLRWAAHACMFLGIAARATLGILTWLAVLFVPTAPITLALIDRNAPVVAFFYDLCGFLVLLGVILAIVRRYVIKDKQLITGQQDTVAVVLLAGIFVLGFVAEGARILMTGLSASKAAYSFVGYTVSLVLGLLPVAWGVVYGWLWYAHAVLVVLLVAYLPFGKFLHVLIGPLVAALNTAMKETHTDA